MRWGGGSVFRGLLDGIDLRHSTMEAVDVQGRRARPQAALETSKVEEEELDPLGGESAGDRRGAAVNGGGFTWGSIVRRCLESGHQACLGTDGIKDAGAGREIEVVGQPVATDTRAGGRQLFQVAQGDAEGIGYAAHLEDAGDETGEGIAQGDEVIGLLEAADQSRALLRGQRRGVGDQDEMLGEGRAHDPRQRRGGGERWTGGEDGGPSGRRAGDGGEMDHGSGIIEASCVPDDGVWLTEVGFRAGTVRGAGCVWWGMAWSWTWELAEIIS